MAAAAPITALPAPAPPPPPDPASPRSAIPPAAHPPACPVPVPISRASAPSLAPPPAPRHDPLLTPTVRSSSTPPSPTALRRLSNFGAGAFGLARAQSTSRAPSRPPSRAVPVLLAPELNREGSADLPRRRESASAASGSSAAASSVASSGRPLSAMGLGDAGPWTRSLSHGAGASRASSASDATLHRDPSGLERTDEVTETPQLRLQRDPETGKKMINQYLVMQEIGAGTHGRVRLGRDTSAESPDDLEADLATGASNLYAIKIVERNPKKKRLVRNGGDGKRMAENEIRKEIAIFKKVHHPNVVRMKEIIDDPESSKLYMILEYCEGGEVEWKGPALSLAETRSIFRDVLLGLEYLHHQGIIHRDIKPSNLLLSGGKVKIADFGCSHFSEALFAAASGGDEAYVDDVELAKTAGSPAFFAPEMCYSDDETQPRHPITNAIDVWALGVTLYCLLFGKTPFDAPNEYLLMQAIPTAQYTIPPTMSSDQIPTDAPEALEALDLLSRLLDKDAMKRISLEQAKRHPFTLRGLQDPQGWLQQTDPHAQMRVTVTNDEVTAAVTSFSLRERFKRRFKSFSSRFRRGRSHSVADSEESEPPSRRTEQVAPAAAISGTNLARRLSLLTTRDRSRSGSSQGPSPKPVSSALSLGAVAGAEGDPQPQAPRQLQSMASLDKLGRERSASNASSLLAGRGILSRSLRQSFGSEDNVFASSLEDHSELSPHPSPERLVDRFRSELMRRGSTLSEDILDEEVDWDGNVDSSESEDDGLPPGHGITSAPADWNLAAALESIELKQARLSPRVNSCSTLGKPSYGSHSPSPVRAPPSSYTARAKSPLASASERVPLGQLPPADRFADADDDAGDDADDNDDGLVLSRRRKGGLSRNSSLMGRSPMGRSA